MAEIFLMIPFRFISVRKDTTKLQWIRILYVTLVISPTSPAPIVDLARSQGIHWRASLQVDPSLCIINALAHARLVSFLYQPDHSLNAIAPRLCSNMRVSASIQFSRKTLPLPR